MTGDGVKELVVVTTRGVQVRKKTKSVPKMRKVFSHFMLLNTRCIAAMFSMVLIFQVLQADLGSVKEVTIERLRSLVSAIS